MKPGRAVAPASRPRRLSEALADAIPDALAAFACVLALVEPDALGFDLLSLTGLLYFVELPLALLTAVAGIKRVRTGSLARGDRTAFLLLPLVLLGVLSALLLGIWGVVAVAWLGAREIIGLLRGDVDRSADVRGLWLVFSTRGASRGFEMTATRPTQSARGTIVVPAGHEQVMSAATLATWVLTAIAIPLLPEFGPAGVTAGYAASVGWDDTVIGRVIPAHYALVAGIVLFSIRTLMHFEDTHDTAPLPTADDDELLREVIEKVEGRKLPRARRRRGR